MIWAGFLIGPFSNYARSPCLSHFTDDPSYLSVGLCDAGFFCRASAYTSSPPDGPNGGLCPVGGYCPIGTAAPLPCDPGYYVPSQGSKSQYDCIPCEPGKYCAGSQGSAATGMIIF